jgi:hypothetical protein
MPTGGGQRTLYFHGNDANNYTKFWIDSAGALRLKVVQAGVPMVDLASPSGSVTNNRLALLCAVAWLAIEVPLGSHGQAAVAAALEGLRSEGLAETDGEGRWRLPAS